MKKLTRSIAPSRAALIVVTICAIVTLFHVLPDYLYTQQLQTYKDNTFTLKKYSKVVSKQSALSENVDQLDSIKDADAGFITAGNIPEAIAKVRGILQTSLVGDRCKIRSIQPSETDQEGSFFKLNFTMHLSGTVDCMQNVLFNIEKGNPKFFIHELSTHSRTSTNRSNQNTPQQLELRFTFYGYVVLTNAIEL